MPQAYGQMPMQQGMPFPGMPQAYGQMPLQQGMPLQGMPQAYGQMPMQQGMMQQGYGRMPTARDMQMGAAGPTIYRTWTPGSIQALSAVDSAASMTSFADGSGSMAGEVDKKWNGWNGMGAGMQGYAQMPYLSLQQQDYGMMLPQQGMPYASMLQQSYDQMMYPGMQQQSYGQMPEEVPYFDYQEEYGFF